MYDMYKCQTSLESSNRACTSKPMEKKLPLSYSLCCPTCSVAVDRAVGHFTGPSYPTFSNYQERRKHRLPAPMTDCFAQRRGPSGPRGSEVLHCHWARESTRPTEWTRSDQVLHWTVSHSSHTLWCHILCVPVQHISMNISTNLSGKHCLQAS